LVGNHQERLIPAVFSTAVGNIHLAQRHMGAQREIVPPAPSGLRQNDPLSSIASEGYPVVRQSIRSDAPASRATQPVGGLTVGSDCWFML
jgi:hypothetical protein